MATRSLRAERRTDSLSKALIVEAAIEILDHAGEAALTFRGLATHLSTGSGAIYWHVADKNALLEAATDAVIADLVSRATRSADARKAIRAIAAGVFDTIEARSWVGTQLSREPWQPAVGRIFEAIGSRLSALGVPERLQFDCASAIVNYLLGVAGQSAAAARLLPADVDRTAFLSSIAERWMHPEGADHPFLQRVAGQLREHDDRAQFLAGLNLLLAGVGTVSTPRA